MDSFESGGVAVNLALFKMLRIFALLDPRGSKIFNCNAHRFAGVLLAIAVQCMLAYGLLGFVFGSELKDGMDDLAVLAMTFAYSHCVSSVFKLATIVYYADKVWDLTRLARADFTSSRKCTEHGAVLRRYREKSIFVTNVLAIAGTAAALTWIAYPLAANAAGHVAGRYENIYNPPYPISLTIFNRYYFLFYLMEITVAISVLFVIILFNTILISFSFVLIAHYEILGRAFENIVQESKPETENEVKTNQIDVDFISVINDQSQVFIKLEIFYSVVKPIIFLTIILTSSSITVLSFSLAKLVLLRSSQSTSMISVFKLISPVVFLCVELYCYCYLLEQINTQKEYGAFGMYCCNWTEMNLRFKQFLLLSMRMNDANKLVIKASPKKIINLMFFANIMTTTYNITSVLVKSIL